MCSLTIWHLMKIQKNVIKAIGKGIVWKYGEHGKSFIQCIFTQDVYILVGWALNPGIVVRIIE